MKSGNTDPGGVCELESNLANERREAERACSVARDRLAAGRGRLGHVEEHAAACARTHPTPAGIGCEIFPPPEATLFLFGPSTQRRPHAATYFRGFPTRAFVVHHWGKKVFERVLCSLNGPMNRSSPKDTYNSPQTFVLASRTLHAW